MWSLASVPFAVTSCLFKFVDLIRFEATVGRCRALPIMMYLLLFTYNGVVGNSVAFELCVSLSLFQGF
jgi:hypothetical protein